MTTRNFWTGCHALTLSTGTVLRTREYWLFSKRPARLPTTPAIHKGTYRSSAVDSRALEHWWRVISFQEVYNWNKYVYFSLSHRLIIPLNFTYNLPIFRRDQKLSRKQLAVTLSSEQPILFGPEVQNFLDLLRLFDDRRKHWISSSPTLHPPTHGRAAYQQVSIHCGPLYRLGYYSRFEVLAARLIKIQVLCEVLKCKWRQAATPQLRNLRTSMTA